MTLKRFLLIGLSLLLGLQLAFATDYGIKFKAGTVIPNQGVSDELVSALLNAGKSDKVYGLIQFYRIPDAKLRVEAEASGVELLAYVPNLTYLASFDGDSWDFLASTEVRAAMLIPNDAKLSERITYGDFDSAKFSVKGEGYLSLFVNFFPTVSGQKVIDTIASLIGIFGGYADSAALAAVALPENKIAELANVNSVVWIDIATPPFTNMNNSNRQVMGVETVWNAPYSLSGQGVKVFIFDGDIVYGSHPDLTGRVTEGESGGYIYNRYHPTHVAGTIGGRGSVNATYKGMAPNVTYYSLRFDWSDPIFYNNPADTQSSYQAAVNWGADLANNSIGSNVASNGYNCSWEGDYEGSAALIDGIIRGNLGNPIITFWAAGNERYTGRCGSSFSTVPPPSVAKNSIAVGALNSNDSSMTDFSSWGPTDDGRLRPDVSAPGCQSNDDYGVTSTIPTNSYTAMCGTSMASPSACGVGALMLEMWRNKYGADVRMLPSTMKAVLAQTAQDLGNTGPDYKFGFGLVKAVPAADLISAMWIAQDEITETGQIKLYLVEVAKQEPLKFTLAWDDAPGTPLSNPNLVNDLDIEVMGPDGMPNYPWLLNPSNPNQQAQKGPDHVNNLEQVVIDSATTGFYLIRIIGYQVPQPPQKFSLVGTRVDPKSCDQDQDTYLRPECGGNDCDDTDAEVNPGHVEVPNNGKDDDCNPDTPDEVSDDDSTSDDDSGGDDDAGGAGGGGAGCGGCWI